jgi:hypothetical protein
MVFGAAQAVLNVAIQGDTKGLEDALDRGASQVDGFAGGLSTALKGAAVVAGAGAVVAGIASVTQAAADDQAEQARLQAAVEATGLSYEAQAAAIDEAIAAGQAKAFTDTEIRNAMVPLIGATGDMTEANELLATAQDVARLTGMDLEQSARALIKVHEGNSDALARYGVTVTDGATATEALAEIQAQAAGQAQTYADTTAGGLDRMGIMFDEVGETVGSAFLPVLEEILPVIIPIIEQFAELVEDLLPVLIPLLKLAVIPLRILARVISSVLDVLGPLIEWLGQAIDVIGEFIGSASSAKGASAGIGAKGAGATSITIYTGADPASVTRALRTYAGDNGGRMPTLRAYGG